MFRLTSEDCSELTYFCKSSGIIGWSGTADGAGAEEGSSRADLAWAAKSQAARIGQHRLRSRFRPHAWVTPSKSSAERSRWQVWVEFWVWVRRRRHGLGFKEPGLGLEGEEAEPLAQQAQNNLCV
ncbi:hypothetical protein FF1_019214 [Malus domestica]